MDTRNGLIANTSPRRRRRRPPSARASTHALPHRLWQRRLCAGSESRHMVTSRGGGVMTSVTLITGGAGVNGRTRKYIRS